MRWVVIGSSGYIGSALCRYLVQAGEPVLSVSRAESGPVGCAHRQIVVFDPALFSDVFQAGDIVVYAAGLASSSDCRKNPDQAEVLNCRLPAELLALADAVEAEQFIYLSSIKAVRAPAGVVATEEGGVPASDSYGGSKWRAEVQLLARRGGVRVNVLRPAAVYGSYCGGVSGGGGRGSSAVEPLTPKRAMKWKYRLRAWCRVVPVVPATGYRSVVALEDLIAAIVCVGDSQCRQEIFIIAEPGYYNLASIGTAASGRCIKSSRGFTHLALFPFKILGFMGLKTGFLDVGRSELYSAERLKTRLNWQPLQRYSRFLGEN
ncbi:NAD(P)-dependent oxidoreductase [uncultured Microbulbifer sp.]|uniref:NAD-dependent epimerase/dehydratase family protein n=1 Tax=uncultured Microbulbifer sp. TaxID=348147 RepID=UPI0026162A90|nr:NAD(P)-dependent oxidoreductase [uncultured Microbulbifer sp.]